MSIVLVVTYAGLNAEFARAPANRARYLASQLAAALLLYKIAGFKLGDGNFHPLTRCSS